MRRVSVLIFLAKNSSLKCKYFLLSLQMFPETHFPLWKVETRLEGQTLKFEGNSKSFVIIQLVSFRLSSGKVRNNSRRFRLPPDEKKPSKAPKSAGKTDRSSILSHIIDATPSELLRKECSKSWHYQKVQRYKNKDLTKWDVKSSRPTLNMPKEENDSQCKLFARLTPKGLSTKCYLLRWAIKKRNINGTALEWSQRRSDLKIRGHERDRRLGTDASSPSSGL